jgi:hypothetical protein
MIHRFIVTAVDGANPLAKRKIWMQYLQDLIREAKIIIDLKPFPQSGMLLIKNTQRDVKNLRN